MTRTLFTALWVASNIRFCWCLEASEVEEPDPATYSTSTPPSVPVEVDLSFVITEVLDVDDKKNELQLEGSLTLTWTDSRINISDSEDGIQPGERPLILDLDWRNKVWLPDLWVESLRHFEIHKSLDDQVTLELFRNKTFVLWQSVSIKTSCPMNFNFYPFDCQVCHLRFSANGLDISKQTFSGGISLSEEINYSQGALQYSDFDIKRDERFSFISNTGREWPQIRASFLLSRRRLDHILQTFQPTGCLVCLSWISFLIPPYIVPGRMVLLVTLLLVVFSTYQSEHDRSPRSSNLKALDIWFVGCLVFLLCAIFEYAVLLLMKRIIVRKRRNNYNEEDTINKRRQDSSVTMTTILDDITDLPSLTPPGSPLPIPSTPSASTSGNKGWFADALNLTQNENDSSRSKTKSGDSNKSNKVNLSVGKSLVKLSVESQNKHRATSAHMVPRYRSSARVRAIRDDRVNSERLGAMVPDSGSEYGDVNETDMEGEELLEKIDETAVKVFPLLFLVFNLAYWGHYMFTSASKKNM